MEKLTLDVTLNDVVPVLRKMVIFQTFSGESTLDVVLKDGRQDQGFEARADVDDLRTETSSRTGKGGM